MGRGQAKQTPGHTMKARLRAARHAAARLLWLLAILLAISFLLVGARAWVTGHP
jgi:hypothetical protein